MKTLKKEHIEELEFLTNWCIFIIEFENEIFEDEFAEMTISDFNKAKEQNNLKGMRLAFNDMNDEVFDLPKEEFTELNRRLKERFGKTLYDFQKNTDKKIAQILKRRKIRNEDEFRLAQMHIDRIFQETEKEEEWKILEDLCFEFEQSVEVS